MSPTTTPASRRRGNAILLTACVLLAPAVPGLTASQRSAVPERVESQTAPQVAVAIQDASETRERFEEVLKKLPPAVARVLRLDPSLMGNETYLSMYPTLAAFIKQHPEVRNMPGYFLEHVGSYEFWSPESREPAAVRLWRNMIESFAIAGVFLTVTFVLIWIVKTLVEYRRWHRTSKVHTEVNNKLLDRFTTNEELLAYIQTPAGRKFIESAPLSMDTPARPVGAPFTRILWSVQVGVVLAAGGLGLFYVSTRVIEEVAQLFFAVAVLAVSFGAGFIASAAASYMLSRRLGLLDDASRRPQTANE
jgi:hypothetical protein